MTQKLQLTGRVWNPGMDVVDAAFCAFLGSELIDRMYLESDQFTERQLTERAARFAEAWAAEGNTSIVFEASAWKHPTPDEAIDSLNLVPSLRERGVSDSAIMSALYRGIELQTALASLDAGVAIEYALA